jgi:hypothetical protein
MASVPRSSEEAKIYFAFVLILFLRFQSDYMKPTHFAQKKNVRQTVTQLGKILLEVDKTSNQNMYCSEFAYHMLGLASCTVDQIRQAGADGASCVQVPFEPMNLVATTSSQVGLADGPLIALSALPNKPGLVSAIFCSNGHTCANNGKLSSGHRAVAEAVAPLMAGLEGVYRARIQGAT